MPAFIKSGPLLPPERMLRLELALKLAAVMPFACSAGLRWAYRGRQLDVRALVRPARRVRMRVQTRVAQVHVHLAPPAVVAPAGRGVRRHEEQLARRVA